MHSVIKSGQVRKMEPGVPQPETQRGTPVCRKSVRLLEVEQVVHAIEFTCSCGEKTVVELDYPEPTQ